ncbi:hypothetical protein VPH35_123418 [Triticum aestivum]
MAAQEHGSSPLLCHLLRSGPACTGVLPFSFDAGAPYILARRVPELLCSRTSSAVDGHLISLVVGRLNQQGAATAMVFPDGVAHLRSDPSPGPRIRPVPVRPRPRKSLIAPPVVKLLPLLCFLTRTGRRARLPACLFLPRQRSR